MRVIFFTSGSGSTAYVTSKYINEMKQITNLGFVYEPNVSIEKYIAEMKLVNAYHFYKVIRTDFTSNENFHADIFDVIKMQFPDVIILAGWMHIIPLSFIKHADELGIKIINLHPTLQYQLIGRDIYPKIWKMYQDGMIRETGCMVHYVTSNLDRGEVIHELKLDLTKCNTFEEYHNKLYGFNHHLIPFQSIHLNNNMLNNEVIYYEGLEKKCLMEALIKLANKPKDISDITPGSFSIVNKLKLIHRGKVRDIYESNVYNKYLFVLTSDRISANDMVIAYLPQKGYLLNQINTFWHKLFGIEQMVCASNSNLMIIRKMRTIPLEIIVRRRITGSLWKLYSQNGLRNVNGYHLPDNMVEGDLFTEPIITPTTKGTHDIPITFNEIVELGILNKKEVEIVRNKATRLFIMGEQYMKNIGIEMIDTKFEFAFGSNNNIEFIDEIFTPDSSRFIVDGVRMDKDILRKWAHDNETFIQSHKVLDDGCRAVQLPLEIQQKLYSNYSNFLNKLQSVQFVVRCDVQNDQCCLDGKESVKELDYYIRHQQTIFNMALSKLQKYVVIIAGSKSDVEHVDKICNELMKKDIITFVHFSSAHKNTENVLELLHYYENQHSANIIYITCAGLSNALSGVVSANTSRPVIACPPFSDKTDYNVNIHSTLQMPSGVPTACILRPDNVAAFCSRILCKNT